MAKFNIPDSGIKAANTSSLLGLEGVLQQVAFELSKLYVNYLQKEGISATGALGQSITPELPIEISPGKATIRIGADKYYDFIDRGVDGVEVKHGSEFKFKNKYPNRKMVRDLRGWMAAKGIGGGDTFNSHAYAIATNIKKKGIKPKNITEAVLTPQLITALEEVYANALERAIDLYFKTLEDGNNN